MCPISFSIFVVNIELDGVGLFQTRIVPDLVPEARQWPEGLEAMTSSTSPVSTTRVAFERALWAVVAVAIGVVNKAPGPPPAVPRAYWND